MPWQLVNAVGLYLSMLAGALIGMISLPAAERTGESGYTLPLLAVLVWGTIGGGIVWKVFTWVRRTA